MRVAWRGDGERCGRGGEGRRGKELIWVDEGSGKGRRESQWGGLPSTALHLGWGRDGGLVWWGRTHCLQRAHLAA